MTIRALVESVVLALALSVTSVTASAAPAATVFVTNSHDVPHYATGTIHVLLFNVDVIDNEGHGVLVDDQDDPATRH
ncbi:MAG TPA: hypothetical protein VH702_17095 [Vicinamibacterales bacterium]|jgi:hypothetical protein